MLNLAHFPLNETGYLELNCQKAVRSFSIEVRKEIGVLLLSLQKGTFLSMPQSRRVPAIHRSAFELRIKDEKGIYRVFYILFFGEKILIPHAFTKKTQKTPKKDIEIAKRRLRRLIDED